MDVAFSLWSPLILQESVGDLFKSVAWDLIAVQWGFIIVYAYIQDSNCSYFKFFTTGENAYIFQRVTHKDLNITAAVLSLLSITLMVMGSICITMVLSKGVEFLLKPASFFFILSGAFVLVTMMIFRQAVGWLMASNQNVKLEYEYSWSVACAVAAGIILIFGGICCLLLVLPSLPKKPWEYCMKKGSSP